jgi:hypothetical protein
MRSFVYAEQPVQQEDTPQPPPPPKLGAGMGEDTLLPDPQLKEEKIFFTSLERHLGHSVLLSTGDRL